MPAGGSNRLIGMADAAEYLSVPLKTLQSRWRDWGLRGIRVGRAFKFRERDLEQWIEAPERAA